MASIVYRVSGQDSSGRRVTERYRDNAEGRAAADRMAKQLTNVERRFDVVLRINGRKVSKSFERATEARAWGDQTQVAKRTGAAIDPRSGRTTVAAYVTDWLAHRKDLRPTTADKYRHLFARHIGPALGTVELGRLNAERVRHWFRALQSEHETTANDAYRFLRAVMNTAVEDGKIASNPCRIKGAGTVRTAERPIIEPSALGAAVAAAPERYRLALNLAAWCQLRRGEILGLQRRHVDLATGTLAIQQARTVTTAGSHAQGAPKTAAGVRRIQVPANLLPELQGHLEAFVRPGDDAWLFTSEVGQPITPRTLDRIWQHARSDSGSDTPLHLHDLRHSGLTWAAATGASTAQLMARGGHASPAAALRYQHATQDQDSELARRLALLAG